MVDHYQVITAGQGLDGLVRESLETSFLPGDLYAGMHLGKALRGGYHGAVTPAVIPSDPS
jgi:hypothetical protein